MLPSSSDPESFFQPSARRLSKRKLLKLASDRNRIDFSCCWIEWPRSEVQGLGLKAQIPYRQFVHQAYSRAYIYSLFFSRRTSPRDRTLYQGLNPKARTRFGWRFIFKSVSLSWTNDFLYIRAQGAQKIHLGKHTRRKGLVLSGLPMSCCLRLNQEERRAFFYKKKKTIIANNETLPLPWGRSANRERGKADLYENGWSTISTLPFKRSRSDWDWASVSLRCPKKVSSKAYLLALKDELAGFAGETQILN